MPKIQKGTNCLFVNLPAQYVRLLGLKKGTEVIIYPAPKEERALLIKAVE